jgi:hypothetical protein
MIKFLNYDKVCPSCGEEFREEIKTQFGLRYAGCKCSDTLELQEEIHQMHLREQFGVDSDTTFY